MQRAAHAPPSTCAVRRARETATSTAWLCATSAHTSSPRRPARVGSSASSSSSCCPSRVRSRALAAGGAAEPLERARGLPMPRHSRSQWCVVQAALVASALSIAAAAATAAAVVGSPTIPLRRCAPDAVVAGTVCLDKYEASVWRVPNPTTRNGGLVRRIQLGRATLADLTAGGATQLGTLADDYGPCGDGAQACAHDVYAVSLPAVLPSTYLTWFQ